MDSQQFNVLGQFGDQQVEGLSAPQHSLGLGQGLNPGLAQGGSLYQ